MAGRGNSGLSETTAMRGESQGMAPGLTSSGPGLRRGQAGGRAPVWGLWPGMTFLSLHLARMWPCMGCFTSLRFIPVCEDRSCCCSHRMREVQGSRASTGEAVVSLPPPSQAPDRSLVVSGLIGSLALAYAGPGRVH